MRAVPLAGDLIVMQACCAAAAQAGSLIKNYVAASSHWARGLCDTASMMASTTRDTQKVPIAFFAPGRFFLT